MVRGPGWIKLQHASAYVQAGLQHLPVLVGIRMSVGYARVGWSTHQVTREPGLGLCQAGLDCSTYW